MQDADLFAFMAIVRELLAVFPKRSMDDDEIGQLSKSYFSTLRRYSIDELQAGAQVWMSRGKFFPKPAEWRESIPRHAPGVQALVPLTLSEQAEYQDAERRKWEGETCACRRCVGAGVDHRFMRYVPETNADGSDARGLIGQRVVVRGRWIHGDDLRRWYDARDAFEAFKARLLAAMKMPKGTPVESAPSPYETVIG